MTDMIDVDRRLRDAGTAWRARQPEPAEPDWQRLAVRPPRRRWPALAAVAAAVAVLVVLGGTALYLGAFRQKATPAPPVASPDPTVTPSATPSATMPPAPPAARLSLADSVVRDGDVVEASGSVLVEPGRPVQFCDGIWLMGWNRGCSGGVNVFDLNLDLVPDLKEEGGVRFGRTWLRGVFRDGGITVTAQARPAPVDLGRRKSVTLCKPPRGGWEQGFDPTALFTYVGARPERFNGWTVAAAGAGRNVYVIGVPRAGLPATLRDLRGAFGPNICVVRVRVDALTERRVRAALERLLQPGGTGIGTIAGGGLDPVRVEISVLSQRLYDRLHAIGPDAMDVKVWLLPVR